MVTEKGKVLGDVRIKHESFTNEKGEKEDVNHDVHAVGINRTLALWVQDDLADKLKEE